MKPDWDTLMDQFKDSETALVADVDCTAEGKALCDMAGVKGYPTLKYGDPSDLQDYDGGRDLKTLISFAETSLKPMCSVDNIDLCDDDKKAQIESYQQLDSDALDAAIEEAEEKLKESEKTFKDEVAKLQGRYQDLMKEKEDKDFEVKSSGLGLMKSVKGFKSISAGNDEL